MDEKITQLKAKLFDIQIQIEQLQQMKMSGLGELKQLLMDKEKGKSKEE